MKADRVFETVIYASDLEEAKRFYGEVLGLDVIGASELMLAFRLDRSVLLIFDPELSGETGRPIPSHGTSGSGHIAFASSCEDLERWRNHLERHDVAIEKVIEWEEGGVSLYVRDPAGNSVEFAPSTLWGGGWDF